MVCKKWEKVHPRNFGDFRSVVSQPCISPRRCSSSRSFFLLSRSCCWLPTHARTHTYKMGDRKAIELKLVRRASGSMLEIRCGSRPVRLRPLVGVRVRAGGAGSWWRWQVVDHHPVRAEQIHRGGTPAPQSPSITVRGSVWVSLEGEGGGGGACDAPFSVVPAVHVLGPAAVVVVACGSSHGG